MAIFTECPKCKGSIQVGEEYSDPLTKMTCPACSEEFLLHEALDLKADSPPEARPPGAAKASEPKGSASDPLAAIAASDGTATSSDSAASGTATGDDETYDDYEDYDEEPERDEGLAAQARRRSKGPSVVGQMIGVFGGGAIGLAAGYYILCFFGGGHYNFLELNLPGIDMPPDRNSGNEQVTNWGDPVDTDDPFPQPPGGDPTPLPEPKLPAQKTPSGGTGTKVGQTNPPTKAVEPPQKLPVTGATIYSSEELGTLLKTAHDAVQPSPGVTPRMNADIFGKLSSLSEAMTYIEDNPDDRTLPQRRRAVKSLAQIIAKDRDAVQALSSLAGRRWEEAEAGGIALPGTVDSVAKEGELTVVSLRLFGRNDVVPIVSKYQAGMTPGKPVLVMGTVVDNPSDNLDGYSGSAAKVIWSGLPVLVKSQPWWP